MINVLQVIERNNVSWVSVRTEEYDRNGLNPLKSTLFILGLSEQLINVSVRLIVYSRAQSHMPHPQRHTNHHPQIHSRPTSGQIPRQLLGLWKSVR